MSICCRVRVLHPGRPHPRRLTDDLAQTKAREVRNYHQGMHVVYASAQPMPKIVAFAGKIGSGKTTITKSLADLLAWPRASFGDYVREAARQRGMKDTREVLQALGTEILRADPDNFCQSVLRHCGWKAGQNLLIDGLRHEETVEIIKALTRATTVSIVFVKISEEVRLDRLMGREGSDANYRAMVEAHSSEAQVNSILAGKANFTVDNDGPLEATVSAISQWIDSISQ